MGRRPGLAVCLSHCAFGQDSLRFEGDIEVTDYLNGRVGGIARDDIAHRIPAFCDAYEELEIGLTYVWTRNTTQPTIYYGADSRSTHPLWLDLFSRGHGDCRRLCGS